MLIKLTKKVYQVNYFKKFNNYNIILFILFYTIIANSEIKKTSNVKKVHNDQSQESKKISTNQPGSKINQRIVKGEANLVSVHMGIIKEDANLLTEEGELVSNVKGVGDVDYEMETYAKDLERIIQRKIKMYKELKTKLDIYKYNNSKSKKERNSSKDHQVGGNYFDQ